MPIKCPVCGTPVNVNVEGGIDVGGLREVVALHGNHAFKVYVDRDGKVRRALPTVAVRADDTARLDHLVYVFGGRVEVHDGDMVTYLDGLAQAMERLNIATPTIEGRNPLVEALAELAAIDRAALTMMELLQPYGVKLLALLGEGGMPIYVYPRVIPFQDALVLSMVDIVRGVMGIRDMGRVEDLHVGTDAHRLAVRLVGNAAIAFLAEGDSAAARSTDVLAEAWDDVKALAAAAAGYRFECYAVGGKRHCAYGDAERVLESAAAVQRRGAGLVLAVSGTYVALLGDGRGTAAAVVRRGGDVWRAIVWLCEATRQCQYLETLT